VFSPNSLTKRSLWNAQRTEKTSYFKQASSRNVHTHAKISEVIIHISVQVTSIIDDSSSDSVNWRKL